MKPIRRLTFFQGVDGSMLTKVYNVGFQYECVNCGDRNQDKELTSSRSCAFGIGLVKNGFLLQNCELHIHSFRDRNLWRASCLVPRYFFRNYNSLLQLQVGRSGRESRFYPGIGRRRNNTERAWE